MLSLYRRYVAPILDMDRGIDRFRVVRTEIDYRRDRISTIQILGYSPRIRAEGASPILQSGVGNLFTVAVSDD